jgi:hypothetical protein
MSGIIYSNNVLNQAGTPALITYAGFPNVGFVGRILINTNDNQIYRDTGNSWELLSGGSGNQYPLYVIDSLVQNISDFQNILEFYVPDTGNLMFPYRISTYLNILVGGDSEITLTYINKNQTQKIINLSSTNDTDFRNSEATILPFPNTYIHIDAIINNGVFDAYACLELLNNVGFVIQPYTPPPTPLNVIAYNGGVENINICNVLLNDAIILSAFTIAPGQSVNTDVSNYIQDADNIFSISNGSDPFAIISVFNATTTTAIPYILSGDQYNPIITITWQDLQPNIADGIEIDFKKITNSIFGIQNYSGHSFNNFTAVVNGSNVPGMTAITLPTGETLVNTNSYIVGSNTIILSSSTTGINVTNIYQYGGSLITYDITGNGSNLVNITINLTAEYIVAGTLIFLA